VGATKERIEELLLENNLTVENECVLIVSSDQESEWSDPYKFSDRSSQDDALVDQEQEEERWDQGPES